MKEHLDTIKVWLMSIGGGLLTLTEALGEIASAVGAIAAAVYTIYKLVILHQENKKKRNELD
jgi:hypothetical protein